MYCRVSLFLDLTWDRCYIPNGMLFSSIQNDSITGLWVWLFKVGFIMERTRGIFNSN